MTKVYVVGNSVHYSNWIPNHTIVHTIKECDLVLFTGGEDVSPTLYNEPKGKRTYCNPKRDYQEVLQYQEALRYAKPMLGICRGAQLLCVLSGGRLIQHQDDNTHIHPVEIAGNRTIQMSSMHHQAMYPYAMAKDEYNVLGWTNGLSTIHLNGANEEIADEPFKEVEIAYFPKIRALGIQGHPESLWSSRINYMNTFTYLYDILEKLLNNTL